jgi:hypothetical protein
VVCIVPVCGVGDSTMSGGCCILCSEDFLCELDMYIHSSFFVAIFIPVPSSDKTLARLLQATSHTLLHLSTH